MRRALLALASALAVPAAALGQERESVFSRLDADGDGFLVESEMRSEAASRANWMAVDRNRDGRIAPDEFEPVRQAARAAERDPVDLVRESNAALRGGYSARRLIGAEVVQPDGHPVGAVRDVLVNAAGAVTGLVVGRGLVGGQEVRLSWHEARLSPAGDQVIVPPESASAGATSAPPLPLTGEWRATQFFDDVVQLERGRRYAEVRDLIVAPWGEVKAIVVDERNGDGLQAYAWRSDRFEPPFDRTHVRNLRPFDYGALGIAAP